jgi:hypothetical protein
MKSIYVILVLIMSWAPSFGQDPGAPPPEFQDPGPAEISVEETDVRSMTDDFLASKGWSEGLNSRGGRNFFVSVGVATIGAAPGSREFDSARINAFGRAMLAAKKDLTELHGVEIRNSVNSAYKEGDFPEEIAKRNAKPTLLEKATLLAHAKLDALLKKEGIEDPRSATEEQVQVILTSEVYRSLTESLARSTISGFQTYKVLESKVDGRSCQIAVVAIQSELLGQMASSLAGAPLVLPAKTPKRPILEQLPKDERVLLTTMGIQQKIDENGQLVLLAFGQAAARTSSDRSLDAAYEKARIQALGMLRSFAGENAFTSSRLLEAETTEEYADGTSSYNNDSAFEQVILTTADSLNISGIASIKRWSAVHPLGQGIPTAGVVVAWSPGDAEAVGRELKENHTEHPGEYSGSGAEADDDGFSP